MSSKAYIASIITELGDTMRSAMTGTSFGTLDDAYGKQYRRLRSLVPIVGPMPKFLNGRSDLLSLWHDAGFKRLSTYDERREFIRKEYTEYYEQRLNTVHEPSFDEALAGRDISVIKEIGKGGFSVVYQGDHIVLGTKLAVKKLDPLFADADGEVKALRRFAREAGILSSLNHPHIVRFRDAGFAGPHPFIIADLAPGDNLQAYVDLYGYFSEPDMLGVLGQVLEAVQTAHNAGVVHRDLKPTNVMWDGTTATVLDFGAGQWVEKQLSTRLTTKAVGTHGYMADELQSDPLLVRPNLDCYSAGVVAHFMLTSRIPNAGDPTYYLKKENVSDAVIKLILRAIAPADARYASASDMLADLRKIQ